MHTFTPFTSRMDRQLVMQQRRFQRLVPFTTLLWGQVLCNNMTHAHATINSYAVDYCLMVGLRCRHTHTLQLLSNDIHVHVHAGHQAHVKIMYYLPDIIMFLNSRCRRMMSLNFRFKTTCSSGETLFLVRIHPHMYSAVNIINATTYR